jgi:tetratricopeptide (TPR) repeat protein
VAYDIIDLKEKCPFDLIIWTTAKTTMLTATGIHEINDALKSSYEILGSISEVVQSDKTTIKEQIAEILEYFEVFNVLLIIDNLETILDETIKDFIREAQLKCKVAITSRIGLGELEYRRLLTGLTDVESVQLVKQIASIRNNNVLLQLSRETLVEIAKKLYHSPLALKWFVNSVDTGLSPNEILNKKADLLNFCLTNVLTKLSDNAKSVINTILASRKSLNDAELAYLTELKHLELRQAINELSTTTLLSKDIKTKENTQEITFTISSFAKDFLIKEHPITIEFVKRITKKIKDLNESVSKIKKADETNEFGLNALMIRNSNEKVVARLIREALSFSKRDNYSDAFIKLEEAKDIAPNYFEIYRISGFLKAHIGDLIGADEDYKMGLEIEPENPRLLFYYAQFLLFYFDEVDEALKYANQVVQLRPYSPYPSFLNSRCFARKNEFEKAVSILEDLLNNNPNISSREKIIANTDLISFSNDWATEKIKLEKDYQSAITIFNKAIEHFENCIQNKEYDQKMLKHICDLLISYFTYIPKMNTEDYLDSLKSFLIKYDNLLSFHHLKGTVLAKFKDNYGIDIINFTGQIDQLEQKYKGNIGPVYENRPYTFIRAEDLCTYFAHRDNFLNISSWNQVRENQPVRFNLGTNHNGVCAVNILIE